MRITGVHFVFCQYIMFSQTEVPTVMNNEDEHRRNQNDVRIRFIAPLTEEFIDPCNEGTLSICWFYRYWCSVLLFLVS